jgi:hypothetical protein
LSSSLTTKCDPETAIRIDQIFKWVLAGHSEHDIEEAIRAQWPEAEMQPLIVAAIGKIRSSGSIDPDAVSGWCFEATRDMYRRMVEIGDFAGALRAIKQLAEFGKK